MRRFKDKKFKNFLPGEAPGECFPGPELHLWYRSCVGRLICLDISEKQADVIASNDMTRSYCSQTFISRLFDAR